MRQRLGMVMLALTAGVLGGVISTRVDKAVLHARADLKSVQQKVTDVDVSLFPNASLKGAQTLGEKINGVYELLGNTTPSLICIGRIDVMPQSAGATPDADEALRGGTNFKQCWNNSKRAKTLPGAVVARAFAIAGDRTPNAQITLQVSPQLDPKTTIVVASPIPNEKGSASIMSSAVTGNEVVFWATRPSEQRVVFQYLIVSY